MIKRRDPNALKTAQDDTRETGMNLLFATSLAGAGSTEKPGRGSFFRDVAFGIAALIHAFLIINFFAVAPLFFIWLDSARWPGRIRIGWAPRAWRKIRLAAKHWPTA